MTCEFPSLIRAIDCMGDKLLVGQRNGTISYNNGPNMQTELMTSHDDGEIWGLAENSWG